MHTRLEAQGRRPPPVAAVVAESALEKVKSALSRRGARGIFGLSRAFRIMDDDGSKSLSSYEFGKACQDFGAGLNEREVMALQAHFDRDGYVVAVSAALEIRHTCCCLCCSPSTNTKHHF